MNHSAGEDRAGTGSATTPARSRRGWCRAALGRLAWYGILTVGALWLVGRFAGGVTESLVSPWPFQCWLGALVIVGVAALGRARVALLAGLVLLAWSTFVVWSPVAPFGPVAASGAGASMRLVQFNLLYTTAPTREALDWIDAQDADVLVLQEFGGAWKEALLERRNDWTGVVWHPHPSPAGIAVLSRHPLIGSTVERVDGSFPVVETTVRMPGGDVRLLVPHPWPPSRDTTQRRNGALKEIGAWMRAHADAAAPAVVIGDLNETPWGATMARMLDGSRWRSARSGFGRHPTWPATLPRLGWTTPGALMIPIDHCLVGPGIAVAEFRTGPAFGSDHRPIVVDLRLPFGPERRDDAAR